MKRSIAALLLLTAAALPLGGCRTAAGTGALSGAALGSAAGALISDASGHSAGTGALIGAGFGLLSGALIGNGIDQASAPRVVAPYDNFAPVAPVYYAPAPVVHYAPVYAVPAPGPMVPPTPCGYWAWGGGGWYWIAR